MVPQKVIAHAKDVILGMGFFKDVFFLVEADSYAYHVEGLALTERYGDRAKQVMQGDSVVIGWFAGHPINVSFFYYEVGGLRIAFYDAVSAVVNHDMVRTWLEERFKVRYDNGHRWAHTNATNMGHCLHAIEDKLGLNGQIDG